MVNAILTAVLTALLTGIVLAGLLFFVYKRVSIQIKTFYLSWTTQPDEKTPSPLAGLVDNVAFIFTTRLITQAKTALMGLSSVAAKNEIKEQSQEILSGSPTLAAILSMIPGNKSLMRNPAILSAAASLFSKLGNKSTQSPVSPGNNGHSQFKLM